MAKRRAVHGGVAVEFAIIVPVMAWIILGVWHFSHSYLVYARLQWAVREGARFAAMAPYVEEAHDTFVSAVKDVVCCGSVGCNCDAAPVVQGLKKDYVQVDVLLVVNGEERKKQPTDKDKLRPARIRVWIKIDDPDVSKNPFNLPYSPLGNTSVTLRCPSVKYPFVGHYVPVIPK